MKFMDFKELVNKYNGQIPYLFKEAIIPVQAIAVSEEKDINGFHFEVWIEPVLMNTPLPPISIWNEKDFVSYLNLFNKWKECNASINLENPIETLKDTIGFIFNIPVIMTYKEEKIPDISLLCDENDENNR